MKKYILVALTGVSLFVFSGVSAQSADVKQKNQKEAKKTEKMMEKEAKGDSKSANRKAKHADKKANAALKKEQKDK